MISICIPCWEFGGNGVFLLAKNLSMLENQTYDDIQIVVSDNSKDNKIVDFINQYKGKLKIKYVQNDPRYRKSAQHNFNNAIRNADGDIISLMCQDDYFTSIFSIEEIVNGFIEPYKWLITSVWLKDVKFKTERLHHPRWDDKIILGFNYIGPPSMLSMRKGFECYFDTETVYYSDCELYHQLYVKYGLPKVLDAGCVTYNIWEGNGTVTAAATFNYQNEIDYIKKKYNLPANAMGHIPV